MYKLLVVEDEKWEREGLRDFLDWSGIGIDVAGCACNGVEGVRMAELYKPEIILTDIMMPKMDGIQMANHIRAFLPNTKIIILSGYDDFQYAKQTFSFHAFAYLLKPVVKEKLEEVILSVLKVLDLEKDRNSERDALNNQWIDYINSNRDQLLLGLLEHKIGLDYLQKLEPINGLRVQGRKVVVIMSLCRTTCDDHQEVLDRFRRILNERAIAFSFSKPFKEAVLCLDAPDTQVELEKQLQRLNEILEKELGIKAIYGVGEVADNFHGAPQSYMQAKEAISYCFLAEYGEFIFYNKVKENSCEDLDEARSHILKTASIINKILYSAKKCDMNESSLLVDDFLSALRENRSTGKMLLNRFFSEASHVLYQTMPSGSVTNFTDSDSLLQTKSYLLSLLGGIVAYTTDKCSCSEDEVAKKVIEIIEKKYADELDLKLISEEIHLTPYYIGNIFKKYTGKQFSQYLNDYRIDKAKEILQSSKIKVGHLAEAVGIRNSSYFCVLFKNRFGISPGDYKGILKGRQEYV